MTKRGFAGGMALLLLWGILSLSAVGCGAGDAAYGNSGGEETSVTTEETGWEDEENESPENGEPGLEDALYEEEMMFSGSSIKEALTIVTEPRDGWVIAFDVLNVRRFCYSNGTVIGTFSSGQKITVNGPARYGFYPVTGTDAETGEEINGYCSAKYVSLVEYTGNAVSLDIVSFIQTDERWSDLTLGESSYTIGKVGCTTTCFAMCESYLTGTEITPADMSEMLTYTNDGNLYWPEEYYEDYTTDYLAEIYMKLHQGIPVLIGSRRKSGGQHWVLVTGYDPGDKTITRSADLKASDFIIRDPSGLRSNLSQFFKDLPYYIKIVYYNGGGM
jgi:hypothetical protein